MVDVIEDIKENVEEGTKDIEEIAEEEGKIAEKNIKKAKKIGKEMIEEIGKGVKKEGEAIERVSKKIAGKAEESIRKVTKEIPRGGKFLVEKLGENVEEGAHKVKKEVKKIGGVFKRDGEEIKEIPREGESILKKLEKSIEKGAEKIEESVEEDLKKVKGVIKKDVKKVEDFLKEKAQKIKGEEKTRIIRIEKEAESESSEEKIIDLEEKKKALLKKAEKLKEKISSGQISTEELKEKIKAKKRTDMLVPLEEYVKAGIYLGTRVVTPNMRPFVYRRRADGLAIFNTDTIDEKLKEGIEFLSKFAPEDVVLICKRQAGWRAAEKFSELTGIRTFTKKYPAGILTNKQLPDFFENELTIITDQWVDKNALNDTLRVHKKVLMICDTNNFSQNSDFIIIGNNKSPKSLGLIFYILTTGYCKARGLSTGKIPDLEWWTGEEEGAVRKELLTRSAAEFGV